MKSSDLNYFYEKDFVSIDLHNQILDELPVLASQNSIVIDKDGNIALELNESGKSSTGHIRNTCIKDEPLDSILTPGIREYKNIVKQYLKNRGMVLPVLRGIQNYHNYHSMTWHKDFVSPEMEIDPKKRIVTFYIASYEVPDDTLMVSPTSSAFETWKIGFKLHLVPNLFIGHNQNLGHEYNRIGNKDINIFSLLWYDWG